MTANTRVKMDFISERLFKYLTDNLSSDSSESLKKRLIKRMTLYSNCDITELI